jgi:hypothetical protein
MVRIYPTGTLWRRSSPILQWGRLDVTGCSSESHQLQDVRHARDETRGYPGRMHRVWAPVIRHDLDHIYYTYLAKEAGQIIRAMSFPLSAAPSPQPCTIASQ